MNQHEDVPARQIETRKREIACADHQRHEEVPEHGGNRWDEEKPDHDHAVHREQLVVGVRVHQVAARREQLQTHERGRDPPKANISVIEII